MAVPAILLVLVLARLLFAGSDRASTGRHRAGVRTPASPTPTPTRAPVQAQAPVRGPNTLPLCSRYRRPMSVRTLHRTIMPRFPVFHGPAVRLAVRRAPRPVPRPAGRPAACPVDRPNAVPRVVPLWAAHAGGAGESGG
ncbi:hypothetical protein AB0O31_14440 [Kitasatospora cineracea]|uniref:hypothetical protein n=1 Tax=Kitasatospora cineracea TaxID=88074 RepID=UPI00341863A9